MVRLSLLVALTAVLGSAAGATGPLCYKAISSGTPFAGDLAPLGDGAVPPRGSAWDGAGTVHYTTGGVTFSLDFGKVVTVADILATVDNNDDYRFEFYDFSKGGSGTKSKLALVINAADGTVPPVPGGMETFASRAVPGATTLAALKFAPLTATTVNVTVSGGDGRFAIGEIELFAPAAVPAGTRQRLVPGPCQAPRG